jgi:hypothetical protein
MRIRTPSTALLALVGTVVVGVLLAPAPAGAKSKAKTMELLYQGGSGPFGGPPVGMSMRGPSFRHPQRLTGFTISVTYDCDGDLLPAVETFPISKKRAAAWIKTDKKQDLTYFNWTWTYVAQGLALVNFQVVGGQHRKDPRVWGGKAAIRPTEAGIELAHCPLDGTDADGFLQWEARLVKACPGRCGSPFNAPAPSWSVTDAHP